MTPELQDIADLITRTADGDRRAFTRLYEATHLKLLSIVRRVLRNSDDADDALQDVYVKIWRSAHRYVPGDQSPISWLAVVARNRALDVLRARTPQGDDVDTMVHLADTLPSPEAALMARERTYLTELSIARLSQKVGGLVRDAYQMGYSYAEVASRHEMPINTVRTTLKRSLAQLSIIGQIYSAA